MNLAIDQFKSITHYDIEKFFNSYTHFVNTYYSNIVNYYKGEDIDKDSFNYLSTLKSEIQKIDSLWSIYSSTFYSIDFWEILEVYENIKIKIDTIENLGRWLRSSRTDRFSSHTILNHVQRQGESIERITQNFGSLDKENDWVTLAIDNDLNEEKYTSNGGVLLKVRLMNNANFDIKNLVDFFTKENLYGKDLQKKLTLSGGDLVTLIGFDSLMQTFETILGTEKGSIPEFPQDGLESNLIGSNINAFNYPSIFRNLMNMFQKDDRFSVLELIDIFKKNDGVSIAIQAKTKIGEILQQEISI
jgi:hypothetical protein